ncbi:MAG TPA: apolipoprotein N-acyltransferase [Blastocatellia bacterium]|nr:apolipoprotein N-acyltransferase [Blastocatellia bacterium]HMV85440.1 apolipoprotein N-acyltransferase [Blastocatellia bacterium]HMX24650.1 apolipoprotein N-acyltransferase [Blastocatellia bacterium]HMY70575.1 apolipoprotein N-acyltransferase [Blastocatellia bacterium]HMZ18066.1 apolipoprotein N-acyltransferase [Blastocatellia bacterium]
MTRPAARKFSFPPAAALFSGESLAWQSVMALATAFLLVASFPNFDYNFLAWVALAPLLFVLAQGVTLRRAFWLGWLAGVVFTFFAENWIAHSMVYFGGVLTGLAYAVAFLFAAVLALFPALFAVAMTMLIRRFGWLGTVFAPAVWVATEWLRPVVTGVTWNALGVSQVSQFPIARLAQYGGVYLISAEIVAASTLIVLLLKAREPGVWRAAAALLIFAAAPFLMRMVSAEPDNATFATVSVAGVQPNLPPDSQQTPDVFARDLENNIRLTKEAISRTPDKAVDIVVWAESPLAMFYETDSTVRDRLDTLARETGSYFIVNTVTRDDWKYFNSIHTLSPRANPNAKPLKRYDKIRLVPFGEYVPMAAVLNSIVKSFATSGVGGFTAGTEKVVNVLRLDTQRAGLVSSDDPKAAGGIERTTTYARVGSFICYEAAYPDLVRGFVRNGAALLVNVSNDAWFGNTAGARQHLAHARMRAIENDRDLVRVTNSGISALVTADGQVIDPLPSFNAGTQVWQAQLRRGLTVYARYGDWLAVCCLIFSGLVVGLALIGNRSK